MSAWQDQQYNQPHQQPWQAPYQSRGSWQDPRLIDQNAPSSSSSLTHTPLSQSQACDNPNATNTSNWGVRFNQNHRTGYSYQNKPPLPPRPASGLAHSHSPPPIWSHSLVQAPVPQNLLQQPQVGHTQSPGYGSTQQWSPETFQSQQSHLPMHYQPPPQIPVPPAPPPRPLAYQSQAQLGQTQSPHQQSSHHSAWLDYDPRTQAQPHNFQQAYQSQQPYQEPRPIPDQTHSESQVQTSNVDQPPPVSPEATYVVPNHSVSEAHISSQQPRNEPSSSALGAGGPSGWEYFQDVTGVVDDRETKNTNAQDEINRPALNDGYIELPASRSETAQKPEPTIPVPATSEVPMREHSVSPEPSGKGLPRTGTIDGLIQAWSAPLNDSGSGRESRKSSISTLDHSRREVPGSTTPSPRPSSQKPQAQQDQISALNHDKIIQDAQERPTSFNSISTTHGTSSSPIPVKSVEMDSYADLDPEYRASLARFAAMLRKEQAASDEDKYKIFKAFVLKETRLRAILYNLESDDAEDWTSPNRATTTKDGKVVAAIPTNDAPNFSQALPNDVRTAETLNSTDIAPKLKVETTSGTNEDSYIVVSLHDESEYSPGGRPRIPRNCPRRSASHPLPESSSRATSSPSDYAPIVIDELRPSASDAFAILTRDSLSRPATAPLAMRDGVANDPIKFEPPRPAYTPFRYAEGHQRGSEPVSVARPASQAYSALRNQSVSSGRLLTKSTSKLASPLRSETPVSPAGNGVRREHEEAFPGVNRDKIGVNSSERQGKASSGLVNEQVLRPDQPTGLVQAMNSLSKIIPTTMPKQRPSSRQVVEAKHAMGQYPDSFTWIPETVIGWDRDNRVLRRKQEEERRARQEESERNIDGLFNGQEIGYSDIAQLETEFKLAEATRKYQEDVQELESFTEKVFKPVTERLKEELCQLHAQYSGAVEVLEHESDSGSQYIHGNGDRPSRSEAMEVVLALYKKLQTRYVKTAEAHYERERRRKKLELSVLYTNSDRAAMRELEREFSKAERQEALHQAREKDSRANKLMNTFDRATVRGLGENQQFVDEVVAKLQSVNDLLNEKQENVTTVLLAGLNGSLRSTEEVLDYVANDTKTLLTMSDQVDNMLNDADYEVSVAEARAANATEDSMKLLEGEKSKEDERLQAEAETRMGSVTKGPQDALSFLRNMLKRIGDDPQHQDRVQKALEAAKLRNALKTPVG